MPANRATRVATRLVVASLVVLGVVGTTVPASADDPDQWQIDLWQLEAEQGITAEDCDRDWLGLHYAECAPIDAYRNYDTLTAGQYGYGSESALEYAKEYSISLGLAPGPGQIARGAVAGMQTVVSGLSTKAAGTAATGLIAVTGAGLIHTAGTGARQWTVDEATTDLAVSPASDVGWRWLNGFTGGLYQNLAFDYTAPDPSEGVSSAFTVTVDQGCGGYAYENRDGWAQCQGYTDYDAWQAYGVLRVQRINADDGLSYGVTSLQGMSFSNGSTSLATVSNSWDLTPPYYVRIFQGSTSQTPVVEWYAPGHPDEPPAVPGGMTGTLTTTLECTSAAGTQSLDFVETYTGGLEMDVSGKECPAGHVLTGGRAEWETGSGTQTVWTYDAPQEVKDIPTEFDHCLTGSDCGLSLWQTLTGQPAQNCGALAVGCQSWWGDASKLDNYECRAGGQVVDLGYCAIYRKPGQISPVVPVTVNPDGTVDVGTRVTTTEPDDYDHLVPAPAAPQPDTDPGTGDPVGPTPPAPIPPPPPAAGDEAQQCWPEGWGVFNPWEWVYRPVTCALSWAFVPRPERITAELDGVRGVVDDHGVLRVMSDAAAIPGSVSNGWNGDCTPMGVDLSDIGADDGLYIECSPTAQLGASGGSSMLSLRNIAAVMIGVFTAWSAFLLVRAHFGGKRGGGDDE